MEQPTCIIDGCSRPVRIKSRGLCSRHYDRFLRYGDPVKFPPGRYHDNQGRECAKCLKYQSWENFSVLTPGCPNGRHSYCNVCRKAYDAERRYAKRAETNAASRAARVADPERARELDRKKYQQNRANRIAQARQAYARDPEAMREAARRYRAAHPERVAITRIRSVAKSYGLDPDLIEDHFRSHGGLCDICGHHPAERHLKMNRLVIDHDHRTGQFRGLLCSSCNTGLGLMQDDPEILDAAIAYLIRAAEARAA